MPGIEARAPERTETSSGRSGSPNLAPIASSMPASAVGDLRLQIGRIGFAVGVEMGAHLGRDREPWRHRQAEIAHFGEVGALAAEQVAHVGPPLGAARGQSDRPISPWAFSPLELPAALASAESAPRRHVRAYSRRADEARRQAASYPSIWEKSATWFITARMRDSRRSRFSRSARSSVLTVTLSKNSSTGWRK